jgi:hypothetical protein
VYSLCKKGKPMVLPRLLLSALYALGLLGLAAPLLGVQLDPGDIVIFDAGSANFRIVHVDGDTGFQTVIPVAFAATAMHLSADGSQILLTAGQEVKSVDPATGLATTVASGGLLTASLRGIDLEDDGDILIGMMGGGSGVVRIDAATSAQERVGSGLGSVNGGAVDPGGEILAAPELGDHIVRMSAGGTVLQDYPLGSAFGRPGDTHHRPTGDLVIMDTNDPIYLLNPLGGGVTELVPDGVFAETYGIYVTQDDRILVPARLVGGSKAIYEVDPITGAVGTFLSGGAIEDPRDVVIVETRPCDDGFDNDGDELIDLADPGCADADDLSEEPDCEDGIDNDFDGTVDHLDDPGCSASSDLSEQDASLPCDNGLDDDGDGVIDFPADPGCDDGLDAAEKSPLLACDDGLDNDLDALTDVPADPGCQAPDDDSENSPDLPCDDGLDNEFDGLTDLDDPGCRDVFSPKENPQCDDDIDNDGDLTVDWDGGQFGLTPDEFCAGRPWSDREKPVTRCGLGHELVALLPLLIALHGRRRSRRAAGR